MAYFLDTHTLLWFVSGDKLLPESSKKIIKNINESCFLSAVSLWEITIKHQLKKLELGLSLEELFEYVDRNQIEIIPINYLHLIQLSKLPSHHGDPFDRLIISQAISENLTLTSKDSIFKEYEVKVIWD
ncbi:type II toxin-antitoxin system VapC family toxin [Algoriphagus sp. oki45]|uniref:type II toxin-antitoxin system VapC family toxin n=1 Tax=Algoriphagus sp. oki45 TaxID=3067294 RepID=UPI0027FC07C8|nr:type II toxin-antitoxin system VapC family toxin [Algoriphagus sp. oki45]